MILAAVILQGLLGGARVVFDERTLAMIHGCTGPLFFALCVAMVVVTSSWWLSVPALAGDRSSSSLPRKTFRLAVVCACLSYVQLVTGAVVRHSPHLIGQWTANLFQLAVYFHLVLALLIVGHVLLLAWRSVRCRLQQGHGLCLLALVAIQVVLGLATWLVKYGLPLWATTWLGEMSFVNREADAVQAAIVTSHVAVGSLVLVVSVAIALRIGRQLRVGLPQWSAASAILVEVAR